jgi:hypothetical protein
LTVSGGTKSARELILKEAERERSLRVVPPWPANNCGWGSPDSEHYAGIHFKHSVAASVAVVEEKAMRRDPQLSFATYYGLLDSHRVRRAPTSWKTEGPNEAVVEPERRRNVRDFMTVLSSRIPGIGQTVCERYVDYVERALVPGAEFSEEEYTVFVGLLLSIIRALDADESSDQGRTVVGE